MSFQDDAAFDGAACDIPADALGIQNRGRQRLREIFARVGGAVAGVGLTLAPVLAGAAPASWEAAYRLLLSAGMAPSGAGRATLLALAFAGQIALIAGWYGVRASTAPCCRAFGETPSVLRRKALAMALAGAFVAAGVNTWLVPATPDNFAAQIRARPLAGTPSRPVMP